MVRAEKAILFGSVAKGKIHQDSDIDLIILSSDFEKIDLMKKINFAFKNKAEIKKKYDHECFSLQSEGI
jgi:predicted nucleotidyltransferase